MPGDGRGREEGGLMIYRGLSFVLSVTLVALGVTLVVSTLVRGNGYLGVILGVLFVGAGAGRIYVTRARP
jgi:heme/copper-type cytochrome/quinol oxidase subunit 4